jgi:hypothetical protein
MGPKGALSATGKDRCLHHAAVCFLIVFYDVSFIVRKEGKHMQTPQFELSKPPRLDGISRYANSI